jgi:alpha-1,2-mannosyltransferase
MIVRQPRAHRYLVGILVAIPVVMILISIVLDVMRIKSGGALPWVYTESNISALLHARFLSGNDSWYPMLAAREWLRAHHGGDVYAALFFNGNVKYQYPDTSLLLIEWLPNDRATATRLLNIGNFGLAAANIIGMTLLMSALIDRAQAAGRRLAVGRPVLLAIGAVATACYYPMLKALSLGQMQILLDLLYTVACYFLIRARPAWSGALVGLSTLVKPQMGLLLVWAIIRRERKFAIGMVSVAAGGGVLSLVVYGVHWPLEYLRVLQFLSAHGESHFANQSVNGLVNRLVGNGVNVSWLGPSRFAPYNGLVYAATTISSLFFMAVGVAIGFRRGSSADPLTSFLIAGICFTLASPIAWQHHYGILLPAFAFCLIELLAREQSDRRSLWGRWVLLAATYLLAANSFAMVNLLADSGLNFLQSYLFFAALATLFLVVTLARSDRATIRFMPWRQRSAGASL